MYRASAIEPLRNGLHQTMDNIFGWQAVLLPSMHLLHTSSSLVGRTTNEQVACLRQVRLWRDHTCRDARLLFPFAWNVFSEAADFTCYTNCCWLSPCSRQVVLLLVRVYTWKLDPSNLRYLHGNEENLMKRWNHRTNAFNFKIPLACNYI